MDSDERAEVLADYLQEVQWTAENVAFTSGRPPLWDTLPVDCGPISSKELVFVIKQLKSKKVGGVDGILPEHFKALIMTEKGLELVLEFCQLCWGNTYYTKSLENIESDFAI